MNEKTQFKWLQKLFIREIEIALKKSQEIYPLQIPKKQANDLLEAGLIEEKVIKDGIAEFRFHRLSDFGRFMYCISCKEELSKDERPSDRVCEN